MMAFIQLRSANLSVVGKSGYCLVYARTVFNVAARYPTAAVAWASALYRHGGTPPPEVAVPVWFRWGSDDHVAVAYKGIIHSTTKQGMKTFGSVQELATYIGGVYLGWSEDINGVRVVQPAANPTPVPSQPHGLPAIGARFQLIPTQTRTTWKAGTATPAGTIRVTDSSFVYTVRGYDAKYPGRVLINTASGGGNGVGLALYLLNGTIVEGWKLV